MKVNVIESSKTTRTLEIEIPEAQVQVEIEKAFKRAAGSANIPGFRKGKIPRDILEKRFRPAVEQEVIEKMVPEAMVSALRENKIEAIGRPKVMDLKQGIPPLSFKAVVEIKPEFELKDIEGLKITAPSAQVSEEEIGRQLTSLQDRLAEPGDGVDGKADKGDWINMDFKGMLDGVAFPGGTAKGHTLVIGKGSLIPGFEDGLVGMKAGETRELKLTFPKDYHADNLAGKKTVFEIKLNEVKQNKVPDIDDAFAKMVGDFENLEALKVRISEGIKDQKETARKNAMASQVEDLLARNHKMELPQSLVESEISLLIDRQNYQLRQQGMEIKNDPESIRQIEKEVRPAAEQRAKVRLILEKIVDREKLSVTHEELHEEIHKLAPQMGLQAEQAVTWFHANQREEGLREQILERKALDWVMDRAKIKEV